MSDRSHHSRYDGFRAAIFVHMGDAETAKTFLKKFKDQRPEVTSMEDYNNVAPGIAMDYLKEGLAQIWES
ncbi:MAG: hypothetical protein HOH05_14865 [Marinovum sp.]|nr:hypothetical protein [Marinovum sp.]